MSEEIPHVISEGTLTFVGETIRVYTLSNGERVFDADDVHRIFGDGLDTLMSAFPEIDGESNAAPSEPLNPTSTPLSIEQEPPS